jgi:hypothetical protein
MALIPEQLPALKTSILADPALAALPLSTANAIFIANEYNKAASPVWIVWKSKVTQDEIMQNGFDWTRVDNLSIGPARVWEWMFDNVTKSINPAKLNVRAGIDAVWKGTASDLAVRAAVYVHCKRSATRAEKLYTSGTGSDASPATLEFEGAVTPQNVIDCGWATIP